MCAHSVGCRKRWLNRLEKISVTRVVYRFGDVVFRPCVIEIDVGSYGWPAKNICPRKRCLLRPVCKNSLSIKRAAILIVLGRKDILNIQRKFVIDLYQNGVVVLAYRRKVVFSTLGRRGR